MNQSFFIAHLTLILQNEHGLAILPIFSDFRSYMAGVKPKKKKFKAKENLKLKSKLLSYFF